MIELNHNEYEIVVCWRKNKVESRAFSILQISNENKL